MVYDTLHDSSHLNAENLDRLYKDVEVCYENFKMVMDDYQKGIGVTPSDVYHYSKGLMDHYEIYRKELKTTIVNFDSDSSDEDFIDNRDDVDFDDEIEDEDSEDDYIEFIG